MKNETPIDLCLSLIPAEKPLSFGWGYEVWKDGKLKASDLGAFFGLYEAEAAAELIYAARWKALQVLSKKEARGPETLSLRIVTDNLTVCELASLLKDVDLGVLFNDLPLSVLYPLLSGNAWAKVEETRLVPRKDLSASGLAAYGLIRANGKLDPQNDREARLVEVLKDVMRQVLLPEDREDGTVSSGCYLVFAKALLLLAEYGQVKILRKKGQNIRARFKTGQGVNP